MFVRQDIPLEHQLVLSLHSATEVAKLYGITGTPNIIAIGVPDIKALRRVEAKLTAAAIDHYAWEEPDNNLGLTSIATAPLDSTAKAVLAHYRLWKPVCRCSSEKEQSILVERSGVQILPAAPFFQ